MAVSCLLIPLAVPLWALRAASLLVWCPIAVRRLRDAGLPPWLAAFPLVIPLAIGGLQRLAPIFDLEARDTLGLNLSLGLTGLALVVCLVALLGVWPPRRPAAPAPEQQAEVFG